MNKFICHMMVLGVGLMLSNSAMAHKVNLFCYFEEGYLVGEGYYSRGRPAQNSLIEIYSLANGSLLSKTQTDSTGTFKVQLTGPESVKVVIHAGQGHRSEFIVNRSSDEPLEQIKSSTAEAHLPTHQDPLIENQISALEQRLMALEQRQTAPNPVDIVAGIGCITGMFSLIYLIKRHHAL
jgi:nickel transport protein